MGRSLRSALAVVCCALASGLCGCKETPAAPGAVEVGAAVPDYTFSTLHGHDGRKSLAAMRGSVVLIDWFGTRCPPCLARAVPHAIELARKHRDDGLICVLVESQGYDPAGLPEFIAKRYGPSSCLLTTESPFQTANADGTLPFSALISADGRLVLDGNPIRLGARLDAAIAAELERARAESRPGR